MSADKEALALEHEVQRIASAIWGAYPGDAHSELIEGRERDCVFRGEEVTHYIECTLQRSQKKVQDDSKKMVAFREAEARKGRFVRLWYVTGSDPTAEQFTAASKYQIKILSLKNFRARLFDGDAYIRLRSPYRWGSATDPRSESSDIRDVTYEATPISNVADQRRWNVAEIAERLTARTVVTLVGDYGMGKSLTIREVFRRLASDYLSGASTKIPVALNLRDHWGQDDAVEALRRHCSKITFDKPDQLVRAYHAGDVVLLLDGFDEIVGTPVAKRRALKKLRSEALSVVRAFVSDLRGKSGVLIAGRQNFFDTNQERNAALGTHTTDVTVELLEPNDEEAETMVRRYYAGSHLPAWLPRRPLFLAYLASQGVLDALNASGESIFTNASKSWDKLIDAICQREKRINEGLDAESIRDILEALANGARETPSGRGPIYSEDVLTAYRRSTGYDEPDEQHRPLLMRLPGLTSRNTEDGSREFIDDSMLDALRAPLAARFATQPYENPAAAAWRHGLSSLGISIACDRLLAQNRTTNSITHAAKEASERWASDTLAADLIRVAQSLMSDGGVLRCSVKLENARIEDLDLLEHPCESLELAGCDVGILSLPTVDVQSVLIRDCLIEKVLGAERVEQLPNWVINCEVGHYDSIRTNASIITDTQLSIGHRVLLTVLRKLFVQPGNGRLESALTRGLPDNYRPHVNSVLELLRARRFASLQTARQQRSWLPDRARSNEVFAILSDYSRSTNPLVVEAKQLT